MGKSGHCVLVFRSAALGDFILACPALAMLRKVYPSAKIVLLTLQSASKAQREKVACYAGNTSRMPWVELAMPHLVDEVVVLDDVQSLRGVMNGRKALSAYSFTQGVLLLDPAAPWLGRIKKLILIWCLVGLVPILGWRGKGSLKGDRAKLRREGVLRHHVHGPLQFLSELKPPRDGYTDAEIVFDLRPLNSDQAWAEGWLNQHATLGGGWVAIAPGSIQPHKCWPLDKFKQLCGQLLHDDPCISLVILGTPADVSLGDELVSVAPARIINLAGKTTISQSAALLSRCILLVGNDGGAMHLGDAMGIKVVSIVPSIEYPDSIEPWHNKPLAVRHSVECAPCYDFTKCPRGHNKCMAELPVAQVLQSCREALERHTS